MLDITLYYIVVRSCDLSVRPIYTFCRYGNQDLFAHTLDYIVTRWCTYVRTLNKVPFLSVVVELQNLSYRLVSSSKLSIANLSAQVSKCKRMYI